MNLELDLKFYEPDDDNEIITSYRDLPLLFNTTMYIRPGKCRMLMPRALRLMFASSKSVAIWMEPKGVFLDMRPNLDEPAGYPKKYIYKIQDATRSHYIPFRMSILNGAMPERVQLVQTAEKQSVFQIRFYEQA